MHTLIFFILSTGGWQNKVILSSQVLNVFIMTLDLPHALQPKSPYPQWKFRSDICDNPGHKFISLSGHTHAFFCLSV